MSRLATWLVVLAVVSCHSSSDEQAPPSIPCSSVAAVDVETHAPSDVGVFVETAGNAQLAFVRDDVAAYLSKMWGAAVAVTDGPPSGAHAVTIWISSSDAARTKAGVAAADDG